MGATTSATLAKMRALREAKRLGCSGAHQTEDGQWHPCSSAESLRAISPEKLLAKPNIVLPPMRRRDQVGTAKIKKQWENLGQRGIVSIDTISGGGLVSGSISKELLSGPRDSDPDTFTDIESARARSRQLGCIGVSRRTTLSGRTVWMPCTNMTDLANRTGRTALGRRNMERQAQRFITEAFKKRDREISKAKVRRKSLLDDLHGISNKQNTPSRVRTFIDIQTKGLGPRIGRGLRSAPSGMTFVDITGAIDADKDGIVFEGKPLERPIIPKFILPDGIARRVQRLIQGTAEQNEKTRRLSGNDSLGEIDANQLASIVGIQPTLVESTQSDALLDQLRQIASRSSKRNPRGSSIAFDDELPPVNAGKEFDKQARRIGKKLATKTFSKIDDIGYEYENLTNDEIAQLAMTVVPSNADDLKRVIKANPYTRKNWKRVLQRIEAAKPDWNAQQIAQQQLYEDLSRDPLLQHMVRKYGMPPIIATEYQPDISNLGGLSYTLGPSQWGETIGGWSGAGFIGINSRVLPEQIGGRPTYFMYRDVDSSRTIRHELAHAWETMAAKQGGPAREHYIQQYQEISEGLLDIRDNNEDDFGTTYHDAPWGTDAEHRAALLISGYAETARIEWFAETIAAMTDPSGAEQRKVNSLSLQNAAAVLGMPTSDLIAVSRGSMRSQILSGRSSKSPRTPINKLLGLPNKDIEDALSFLRSNPEYIEDAPDELLARMDDGDFEKSIRDYASSLRSSRTLDSDILQAPQKAEESRRKGELGQTIIDYLMNQASGPNSSSEYPTLWFIGGTTGSGKTTLRTAGIFDGVPTPSQAVDIDPDVIKSMHPDWDNGNGAQKIHRWSTQWTRYGLRQAMAQQRDTVITGTGVRTDQLTTAKRNGYLTVGHFVYVPTDKAVKNMRQRAKSGGTNLPDYFAERYASELEYKITSAIRSGDLDEFYLWDNSTDTPKLAARRTRDGRYDIFNRSIFEAFLGKQGARQVEDHWARNASTASSNYSIDDSISSRSSRSLSKLVPRRDVIMTQGREQLKVSDRDISKIDTRHSMLEGVVIGSGADISKVDWFSSTWKRVKAENLNIEKPLVMDESSLTDVSFSRLNAPVGSSFAYTTLKSVDFSKSKLDGADFTNSDLSNVDFTSTSLVGARFKGAVLRSVDFSGADLSQSDLTPDDIKGSGIVWSTSTKFSPEITEFLLTQKIKKNLGGKFILDNRTSASSAYNRAADTYGSSRRIRRSNINGLPRGPRTALHEARTPGSDKLLIQNKTLDGIDVSHFNLGNLEIGDTVISRPRMREMRAIDAKFNSVQIIHADGERLSLVRATFVNTSIRDSDLHRSNFNGSTVIGQLNLSGSNLSGATLRGIRFGNGSINGLIDVRGCDLSNADLDGIDLRRLRWDARTNWSGAKLPHIPSRSIPPDLRGKVISGRSTRAVSHGEILSSINNINDAWIDFSKLSSVDKNEEAQNLLSSYRSIFNTIDEIDSIEGSIASMRAQRDIALKQLEPFEKQNLPNGEIINLLLAIEKGDRSSFANEFTKLQIADSNSFKNESMLDVWKRGSDLVSMRDSVDIDINELEIQHNDFKRAAGTANTLDLIANSDLGEIKKYPGVNPNLPDGKRVGPVSARSTIRELPLNSPKYIDDLFNDPLLKEALETFPDINEDEQLLKSRFQEFSYEFNSQLQELLDGKYDNIPAHPLAGTSLRDAINNTRIIIYSDGTHSIVAPQNALLSNMLPDRRDWSTVELPDKGTIQKTTNILNANGSEYRPGSYSADDITAMSNSVAEKLIDHIFEKLATIDKQEKPASFMKGMSPYLMNYLRVLNNPHDWLNGMDPESVDGPAAILALHDGFGHFAIGRGFDRHGEWAVTMAMLSLVRDNAVDLLEDERQAYGREVLARFGTPWLAKRLTNSEEISNVNKLKKAIYYYDGDIFDVIDSLDPRDVGSQAVLSSRSARRNEYAILTPEKLREVSRIEARDKLLQELRNKRKAVRDKRSPKVQQRQMRRDARRRRIQSQSPASLDASAELAKPDSSRSVRNPSLISDATPSKKLLSNVSATIQRGSKPRLKVDSNGTLIIDSSNMALSDIGAFDIAQITESDLPKNFNPQMPSSMRVLVARTELLRWKERNVVEVNDDGTISGKRLYDNNPKYGSTAIFKQDLIARLSDGHSVIVRDLPSDYHTGATKMAVVTKVGSTLVAFELDDNEISDIETGLKQLRSNIGGPIGLHSAPSGNFDGTEIFDISQIHQMLPSTSEGSLKDRLDAVIDFQAQLSGIDGDLPKPSILMKKQSYYGLVSLPPEVIEQYGGREAVSKKISGIAFADDNSFVMYNSGTSTLNPSTMVHEWAHVADKTRGKNGGLVSTSELWSEAANLDREFGQDLIGTDKALSLAISEYRLKPPMIQSGKNVRQISPNLSPRIGMVGVTQYGDVSPTEDFAEASKLFILDKTYGYVAQEVDFDGRPIPGGRQWTFAELYPNRAKQLERIYFGTSQGDPTQISSRSSRKFDSRFKSSYGHNVPQGDGDCFVSAVEGIDRLTSSEFNIDPSQIRIVHGIPMGTGGEAEGMRFPHAWIEVASYDRAEHEQMIQETEQLMKSIAEEISVETKQRMTQRLNDLRQQIFENEMSTTVYDFSNGNEAIVPAALYYAIGKINKEDNRYYSRDAANEMMATNGHYGPWD